MSEAGLPSAIAMALGGGGIVTIAVAVCGDGSCARIAAAPCRNGMTAWGREPGSILHP